MKTNPTKFAVICVKNRQKARFLSTRSSKIKVTKEKERRKRRARSRKGREEKKAMIAFLGTFLKHEKLQNHSNERKGKKKRKERGEGKEEKIKN